METEQRESHHQEQNSLLLILAPKILPEDGNLLLVQKVFREPIQRAAAQTGIEVAFICRGVTAIGKNNGAIYDLRNS